MMGPMIDKNFGTGHAPMPPATVGSFRAWLIARAWCLVWIHRVESGHLECSDCGKVRPWGS